MKSKKWQLVSRNFYALATVLFLGAFANAQTIYSINANTSFGDNAVAIGTGTTFGDSDSDGLFELTFASNSGNNVAGFIESSDGVGQTINDLTLASSLGRTLLPTDTVIVSGTWTPTDFANNVLDANANGFEMGVHSVSGFRANPNILMQLRANAQASGTPAFFEYVANNTIDPVTGLPVGSGLNVRNNAIPALTDASLNDGFSFSVAYSATEIVLTATDVVDAASGVPTTVSYTFTHGVDTTSSGGTTGFDFLTDVGDGFAYFSFQKASSGFPGQSVEFSEFQVEVVPEMAILVGDVNCDGAVNFLDISPFISALSSGMFVDKADIDRSGMVNFLDIAPFIGLLAGP